VWKTPSGIALSKAPAVAALVSIMETTIGLVGDGYAIVCSSPSVR